MPITTQAKKALRKARKHALHNQTIRNAYKDAIKAVRKAKEAGQDANELLRLAQKKLDKAAKRGVIKSKTAARKLSRLTIHVQKAVAAK